MDKTEQAIIALITKDHCKKSTDYCRQVSLLFQNEFASKLSDAIDKSGDEILQIQKEKWHLSPLISDLAFLLSEKIIERRHAKLAFEAAWDMEPYAWDLCWYLSGTLTGERILDEEDESQLHKIIQRLFAEKPAIIEEIKKGKEKAAGGLLGPIMRETKGKADPIATKALIIKMAKEEND